jgi:CMP/dCMP kinase
VHGTDDDAAIEATRDHVLRRDAQDATVADFLEAGAGVTVIDSSALSFGETVEAVLAVVGRVGADR